MLVKKIYRCSGGFEDAESFCKITKLFESMVRRLYDPLFLAFEEVRESATRW